MKLISTVFGICLFAYLLIFAASSAAQTMENGMYMIEEGDVSTFDIDSFISKDNNTESVERKPGHYSGNNYTVKSGNDYDPDQIPLSFSISNLSVDFSSLSPTNPVLRTTILTVKNNSGYSYKVTAAENNQLTEVKSGSKIPDTRCDDGKCNEAVSSQWTSTLTYGFGYRCDVSDQTCSLGDESFTQEDFYKQFPDTSLKESAAEVLSGGPEIQQKATIIYKVNISSSQPQGLYSNTVTFLALPSY